MGACGLNRLSEGLSDMGERLSAADSEHRFAPTAREAVQRAVEAYLHVRIFTFAKGEKSLSIGESKLDSVVWRL